MCTPSESAICTLSSNSRSTNAITCGSQNFFSGEQTPVCGRIPGIPGKFMRIRCVENIGNRTAGQYIGRLLRQGARLGYLYHNLFFGIKIVKRFQAPSLFGASHRFTRFFIYLRSPVFSVSRFAGQPYQKGRVAEAQAPGRSEKYTTVKWGLLRNGRAVPGIPTEHPAPHGRTSHRKA